MRFLAVAGEQFRQHERTSVQVGVERRGKREKNPRPFSHIVSQQARAVSVLCMNVIEWENVCRRRGQSKRTFLRLDQKRAWLKNGHPPPANESTLIWTISQDNCTLGFTTLSNKTENAFYCLHCDAAELDLLVGTVNCSVLLCAFLAHYIVKILHFFS